MNRLAAAAGQAVWRRTEAKLRAVAYLRVSTGEQARGYGIAYTGKRVTRYVEGKDWEFVRAFVDEGFSGQLDHTQRPALRELMAAAQCVPRPFDVVVVPEERAIGRRGRAFWPWVWQLEDLGIFVAIVKGDYDNTTEDGRSRMRKAQDAAEDERVLILDRTQAGVQEKAEAGGWPGGRPPYGYRIENQGRRGQSRIVLDKGDEQAPYAILHRARQLIAHDGLTCGEIEQLLEAEGIPGAESDHWPPGSLRRILLGRPVQESRRLFRDPASPWIRTDADGTPLFGAPVEIKLEPIFSPQELHELNQALARTDNQRLPRHDHAIHPLSRHVFALCGAHYTGLVHGRSRHRSYRCSGNRTQAARTPKCGCPGLDADQLELHVRTQLRSLLAAPDRLTAPTEPQDGTADERDVGEELDFRGIDAQIAELEMAISAATASTVRMAIRRRLGAQAATDLAERATSAMEAELDTLEARRDKALQRRAIAKDTRLQAADLHRLAQATAHRLDSSTPAQLKRIYSLLELRVTVLGPVPRRRVRSDDALSDWFRTRDLRVPLLTDEAWDRIAPVFARRRGRRTKSDPRAYVEAILTKARTGRSWNEFPGAHSIWQKWSTGLWAELIALLIDFPGTPIAHAALLPPLRIEGTISTRLEEHGTPGQPDDDTRPLTSASARFQMTC
ncbi:recombinase family protein [Streptacidiphilus sp. MAP5-52]|uniref:recombinase family protein n=1 Tax=Streptacidiphilus sp. MAP5-52 TaxID=3156267 RepID=UPI0035192977